MVDMCDKVSFVKCHFLGCHVLKTAKNAVILRHQPKLVIMATLRVEFELPCIQQLIANRKW